MLLFGSLYFYVKTTCKIDSGRLLSKLIVEAALERALDDDFVSNIAAQ